MEIGNKPVSEVDYDEIAEILNSTSPGSGYVKLFLRFAEIADAVGTQLKEMTFSNNRSAKAARMLRWPIILLTLIIAASNLGLLLVEAGSVRQNHNKTNTDLELCESRFCRDWRVTQSHVVRDVVRIEIGNVVFIIGFTASGCKENYRVDDQGSIPLELERY